MEPLKEFFNKAFYEQLAAVIQSEYADFQPDKFVKDATKDFEPLSLNERMRNTSVVLKQHLPADYTKTLDILYRVIPKMKTGYTTLVFPDFVSQFGLEHQQASLEALKYFTQFGSSEFAIRVFLKQDFQSVIQTMVNWAEDKNHHVRRLASEGSRPRLPWSFKLQEVIDNPAVTQPILERLNADEELYVRKSVANHLNDFSKDNVNFMLDLVKKWDQSHPHTAWIIKHGTRTLIKKGNDASLSLFGFEENPKLRLERFSLNKEQLQLGEELIFTFDLVSEKTTPQKLVVDYIMHYRKSSGETSPKVFKLKDVTLQPGETLSITKKQRMQDFSTRKHYPGIHAVEIQVNGKIYGRKEFELKIENREGNSPS